jgi:hypothetical protein
MLHHAQIHMYLRTSTALYDLMHLPHVSTFRSSLTTTEQVSTIIFRTSFDFVCFPTPPPPRPNLKHTYRRQFGGANFTLAFRSLDEFQLCLFPNRSHLSLDEDEKLPANFASRVNITPRHVRDRLQAEAHVRYEDVVRAVEERNLQDGAG